MRVISYNEIMGMLPIEFEGTVIDWANRKKSFSSNPSASGNGQRVFFSRKEIGYLMMLNEYGYVRKSEFGRVFHGANFLDYQVQQTVSSLTKKLNSIKNNPLIKTRSSSGNYEGGYYIGNLSEHRKFPLNLFFHDKFCLNKVTGCLETPNEILYFSPLDTEYLKILFEHSPGGVSRARLWEIVSEELSDRGVDKRISEIRKQLMFVGINDLIQTKTGFGYGLK